MLVGIDVCICGLCVGGNWMTRRNPPARLGDHLTCGVLNLGCTGERRAIYHCSSRTAVVLVTKQIFTRIVFHFAYLNYNQVISIVNSFIFFFNHLFVYNYMYICNEVEL